MEDVFIVARLYLFHVVMLILLRGRNGGLGIPENVVTLCPECHWEEDFGQNCKDYEDFIEKYLRDYYGESWKKENLIYKKYGGNIYERNKTNNEL